MASGSTQTPVCVLCVGPQINNFTKGWPAGFEIGESGARVGISSMGSHRTPWFKIILKGPIPSGVGPYAVHCHVSRP